MEFLTATHTDVGIKKKTNQDSILVHQAQTDYGAILLAVVCDGMGGLSKGEVASAEMIREFSRWFQEELPELLYSGMRPEALRVSWENLVVSVNHRIADYADRLSVTMGTTCVAFLAIEDIYYIMNIGDSRVYMLSDNIYQLTKDQTYVQREIDAHRMTPMEAEASPQRSVLLQCIGASEVVQPDFFTGSIEANQCYLLCSDGFRHVVGSTEIFRLCAPSSADHPAAMKAGLEQLTELNKNRMETDNISAVLIRTR